MRNTIVVWKIFLNSMLILVLVGLSIYAFEHWGDGYMSRLFSIVAAQGRLGPVIFMAVNAIFTILMVPQSLFTVAAGALFGWKVGMLSASIGMTLGATCSFLIARYGLRDWLRVRFERQYVFRKMQQLSQTHPFHVISLSRLIPVVPFPVASYLLGVTGVRTLPFVLLTWVCMLPESLFLASGGHLLHSSFVEGHGSIEAAVVLGVGAVVFGVFVHRMKKKLLESEG